MFFFALASMRDVHHHGRYMQCEWIYLCKYVCKVDFIEMKSKYKSTRGICLNVGLVCMYIYVEI